MVLSPYETFYQRRYLSLIVEMELIPMSSDKKPTISRTTGGAILGANASTTAAIAFSLTGVGFVPFVVIAGIGAAAGAALFKATERP